MYIFKRSAGAHARACVTNNNLMRLRLFKKIH